MGVGIFILILPLLSREPAAATIINLREVILRERLCGHENQCPTDAVRTARRDGMLMELAYLHAGTVDPVNVSRAEYREFVVLHEILRQNAEAFADPDFQLQRPKRRELFRARASFDQLARHCLRFHRELNVIRMFWSEMSVRALNRLDSAMPRELDRLSRLLAERLKHLVACATPRERYASRRMISHVRDLAANLDRQFPAPACEAGLVTAFRRRMRVVE